MKRPSFETFLHHFSTTEDLSPTANCSSLFRKDLFTCLTFYNYLFVSFLIRFSMNNPKSTYYFKYLVGLIESRFAKTLMRSVDHARIRYADAGGLEWTRTTDLPLIRRVL